MVYAHRKSRARLRIRIIFGVVMLRLDLMRYHTGYPKKITWLLENFKSKDMGKILYIIESTIFDIKT